MNICCKMYKIMITKMYIFNLNAFIVIKKCYFCYCIFLLKINMLQYIYTCFISQNICLQCSILYCIVLQCMCVLYCVVLYYLLICYNLLNLYIYLENKHFTIRFTHRSIIDQLIEPPSICTFKCKSKYMCTLFKKNQIFIKSK